MRDIALMSDIDLIRLHTLMCHVCLFIDKTSANIKFSPFDLTLKNRLIIR